MVSLEAGELWVCAATLKDLWLDYCGVTTRDQRFTSNRLTVTSNPRRHGDPTRWLAARLQR